MAKRRCTRCEREQSDTATICHQCARDLKKTLQHIANLWPHLEEAIGKRTAMGSRAGNKPTKASEQPLPVDMHASQVAARARGVLVGWVRVLCEDNRLAPPVDTVPAMCGWLRDHMGVLRMHEAAVEAADEITWASGDISRAVDYPLDRSVHPVGPCPETVDEAPCDGTVKAHQPRDSDKLWYDCAKCGAIWDSTQLTRLGERINKRKAQIAWQKAWGSKPPPKKEEPKSAPVLEGLNLAAVQYGIPPGTLRRWVTTGVLAKYGDGKPWLVDLVEVERLKDERRIAG